METNYAIGFGVSDRKSIFLNKPHNFKIGCRIRLSNGEEESECVVENVLENTLVLNGESIKGNVSCVSDLIPVK